MSETSTGTEVTPSGLIVQGQPLNVNARVTQLSVDTMKRIMYNDFLDAKELAQIPMDYTFDEWVRDSLTCLVHRRRQDVQEDFMMGKLSRAERDALEELRIKMIEVVSLMDTSDLDKYGVQWVDQSARQYAFMSKGILTPLSRHDVVKPAGTPPKQIIVP